MEEAKESGEKEREIRKDSERNTGYGHAEREKKK